MTEQRSISLTAWALLGLLALIWGASFISNRAALTEVPVLTTVAIRVTGGACALWIYIAYRRLPVPKGLRWLRTSAVLGLTNNINPISLIVWGQTYIPSGLAGILNAATAIFSVVLAALFFPDERLTGRRAVGVALGLTGVAIAIGQAALSHLDPTSLGQLAILAAAFSYALSAMFGRRALAGIRPEVGAAGMLTASACVMLPLALWHDGLPAILWQTQTYAALAYLALIASAFAYILFYSVLQLAGAGNLGLVALLIAPVAVILGAIVYHETLATSAYAGFAVIALGMLVLDRRLIAKQFA